MAGRFYPAEPGPLRRAVTESLVAAGRVLEQPPKAVIAPHAGYVYSGPIAGSAFAPWTPLAKQVRRIVLIGPSHYVAFSGLALSTATAFATPLGPVPVDPTAHSRLTPFPQVQMLDAAHAEEHALEVELPFLQFLFADFQIVPLVVGDADDQAVGEVLDCLWNGPETRFVISSDLSHFHDYNTARTLDSQTAQAIEHFEAAKITPERACGHAAIRGFLWAARQRRLSVTTLDLRNSGDTAGSRSRVVGYGAFAFGSDAAQGETGT